MLNKSNSTFTAVELGVNNHWQEIIKAAMRIAPKYDWTALLDKCWVVGIDTDSVPLYVNSTEAYNYLASSDCIEKLEQALLHVFKIPWQVKVIRASGLSREAYKQSLDAWFDSEAF